MAGISVLGGSRKPLSHDDRGEPLGAMRGNGEESGEEGEGGEENETHETH
jgi:hypothetical protein